MRYATMMAAIWLISCANTHPGLEALPLRGFDDCNLGDLERVQGLDVAIAIDASGSTADPSGSDIDANGTIGQPEPNTRQRGDSLLSAQVAGVKSLIPELEKRDLRVSIVRYSGPDRFNDPASPNLAPATRSALTSDAQAIAVSLDRLLGMGSRGTSDFAAAMGESLDALDAGSEPATQRRRVVLMMSDSPTPVRPAPTQYLFRTARGDIHGPFVFSDPHMAVAAKRAIRSQTVINTFGLGNAATADPPHYLSLVAGATGGQYRVVEDPTRLHCQLVSALAQ